jgi:uncharacterized protein YbcI
MTKGQLEAKIAEAMMRFQREHMGRGPTEGKAFIVADMVIVRLQGVLTPAERELAKMPDGRKLLKQVRVQLLETTAHVMCQMVEELIGAKVRILHTDISIETGELAQIFVTADR